MVILTLDLLLIKFIMLCSQAVDRLDMTDGSTIGKNMIGTKEAFRNQGIIVGSATKEGLEIPKPAQTQAPEGLKRKANVPKPD